MVFHEEFITGCVKETMLNDAIFSKKLLKCLKICTMATQSVDHLASQSRSFDGLNFTMQSPRISNLDDEEMNRLMSRIDDFKRMTKSFTKMFDTNVAELLQYMDKE